MDPKRPWLRLLDTLFQPPTDADRRRHHQAYGDLLVDLGLATRAGVEAWLKTPLDQARVAPRLSAQLIDRKILSRANLAHTLVAEAAEDPDNWRGPYILTKQEGDQRGSAWDTVRRRFVQLVVVSPEDRIRLERRSTVEHPVLAKIFEFGVHDGKSYVTVEQVEGVRLGSVPRGDRRRLLEAARDAALALAALHERQLTHGAVSLETILIDDRGATRLIGWGTAADDVRPLAAALYELLTDRPAPGAGVPKSWPKRLDDNLRGIFEKALGKRPPKAAALAELLSRRLESR